MNLQSFVNNYGYIAVLAGTFVEGETILVLGGVAAKMGYLELQWVMVCAFIGSLCGDQLIYHIGRRYGTPILSKKQHWAARAQHVYDVYVRYEIAVLLGFRFIYGMRTITPIALGAAKMVAPVKFLLFNMLGAAMWSALVASLGFLIGHGVQLLLGDIKRFEIALMSAVILSGLGIWLWRVLRKGH